MLYHVNGMILFVYVPYISIYLKDEKQNYNDPFLNINFMFLGQRKQHYYTHYIQQLKSAYNSGSSRCRTLFFKTCIKFEDQIVQKIKKKHRDII